MATILCIEDEVCIRQTIVEELEEAGYKALQAGNGVDGLAAITRHKPDLVLCDITMPRMSGYDLLVEIRANHPEFAEMPIFFVTALADRKDALNGLAHGADDYIAKPIDFEVMLAKVDAALRLVARMRANKEREQVKLFQVFAERMAARPAADPSPPPADDAPRQAHSTKPEESAAPEPWADAGTDAKREAKRAVGPTLVEEVAVKFQPVWSPKAEKVIAYHGSAYQTIAGALGNDAREKNRAEVDIMVATRIVEHLELMATASNSAAIILSVSPETLLGPRRGTFNALLTSRPEAERKRRLMIELAPVDAGIEDTALQAALEAARPLAGTILVRAGPHDRIGIVARGHCASALSWRFSSSGKETQQEIAQRLSDYAGATLRLGMHPYVFNLDVIGTVKAATRGGFSLIGGRAVAKELDQPGDPFILQPHRLFFD